MKKLILCFIIVFIFFGCSVTDLVIYQKDDNAKMDSKATSFSILPDMDGMTELIFANTLKQDIFVVEIKLSNPTFILSIDRAKTLFPALPLLIKGGENVPIFFSYLKDNYSQTCDVCVKFSAKDSGVKEKVFKILTLEKPVIQGEKDSGIVIIEPISKMLDFKKVLNGKTAEIKVVYKNATQEILKINSIRLEKGINFKLKNTFIPFSLDIESKVAKVDFYVIFSPTDLIDYKDKLIFETDRGIFFVDVFGQGNINEGATLAVYYNGNILKDNEIVDLGNLATSDTKIFQIKNLGREILNVTSIKSSNSGFTIAPDNFSLGANLSKNIVIGFSSVTGNSSSLITFISNDNTTNSFILNLKVKIVDSAIPRLSFENGDIILDSANIYTYLFPNVKPNDAGNVVDITVNNLGTADLIISNIEIEANSFFSVTKTLNSSTPIKKGIPQFFSVKFKSTTEGYWEKNLVITSNNLNNADPIILILKGGCVAELPLLMPQVASVNLIDKVTIAGVEEQINPIAKITEGEIIFKATTSVGSKGIKKFKYSLKNSDSNYVRQNIVLSDENVIGEEGWKYIRLESLGNSDGIYTLEVYEADSKNNWSQPKVIEFLYDVSSPSAPIVEVNSTGTNTSILVSGVKWANDKKPEWSWTPVSAGDVKFYIVSLDTQLTEPQINSKIDTISEQITAINWKPSTNLSDGQHILYVYTIDKFKRASESGSALIKIDTTPPTINLAGSSSVSMNVSQTANYDDAGSTYSDSGVGIDASTLSEIWSGEGVPTTGPTGKVIGVYGVKYKINDKLGNVSSWSTTRTVRVYDNSVPNVQVPSSAIDVNWGATITVDSIVSGNSSAFTFSDNSGETLGTGLTLIDTNVVAPNTYKAGQQKLAFKVKDSTGNTTSYKVFIINVSAPVLHNNGNNLLQDPGFEMGDVVNASTYANGARNNLSEHWTLIPYAMFAGTKGYTSTYYENVDSKYVKDLSAQSRGPIACEGSSDEGNRTICGVVNNAGKGLMWYQARNCPFGNSANDAGITPKSGSKCFLVKGGELPGSGVNQINSSQYLAGISVGIVQNVALNKGMKYRASTWVCSGDGRGGTGTAERWGWTYVFRVSLCDDNTVKSSAILDWNPIRNFEEKVTGDYIAESSKSYNIKLENFMNGPNGTVATNNTSQIYYFGFIKYDDAKVWCTGYDQHPSLGAQTIPASADIVITP